MTEDPETIGAGRILLEGGIEYGGSVEFPIYGLTGNLWRVPSFGVSIGISSIAEIQIDSGYSRLPSRAASRHRSHQCSTSRATTRRPSRTSCVATKVRVVSEGTNRPSFGLRMATKLPNARNQSGLGTDMTDVSLAVLVGKTIRSIRVVGNLGVAVIGDPTQNGRPVRSHHLRTLIGACARTGFRCGRRRSRGGGSLTRARRSLRAENRAALRGGLRYTRGAVRVDAGLRHGVRRCRAGDWVHRPG